MKTHRVGILGSYGGMNLGDEAILEVILRDLREHVGAETVVFSRHPEDTQQRHQSRAVPIRQMHKEEIQKEINELDLLILGGGGILFEKMAQEFLPIVQWAQQGGVPVMVYAISVGPITTAETKKMLVKTFNRVGRITVREDKAKKILQEMGVEQEIEVTADPALLLEPESFSDEMMESHGIVADAKRPLIGFSVREPGSAAPDLDVDTYHEVLANAADFMVERFQGQILFVPMEQHEHKDLQHSHAVIARMSHARDAQVLKGDFTSSQILGLVGRMEFVVAMRLHLLIFAAIQKVPFVPLPYASKVMGFLSSLDMPVPPLDEINAGKLCAFLDRFWDERADIRTKLTERLPGLQELSRRNIGALNDFLSGEEKKKDTLLA